MSVQGKDLLEVDKRWRCHHDRRQCCKRFDDTGRSSIGRQDRSALLIAKETVLVDSFVKRVRDWMVSTISPSSTSSSASEADAGTATVSLMLFELNPRALPTSAVEARVRTRSVHPRPQSSVPAPPVLTIADSLPSRRLVVRCARLSCHCLARPSLPKSKMRLPFFVCFYANDGGGGGGDDDDDDYKP